MIRSVKKFGPEKINSKVFCSADHNIHFEHIYTVVTLRIGEPPTKETDQVLEMGVVERLLSDRTNSHSAGVRLQDEVSLRI